MLVTCNVQDETSLVRVCFWIAIVAQVIGLWGVLMSIIIPVFIGQPSPPPTMRTTAARYRLLTQKRSKRRPTSTRSPSIESKKFGTTFPKVPLVPRAAVRSMTTYDCCPMLGSSTIQLTFYEAAAACALLRSHSTDGVAPNCLLAEPLQRCSHFDSPSLSNSESSSTISVSTPPARTLPRARRLPTISVPRPLRAKRTVTTAAERSFSTSKRPVVSGTGALSRGPSTTPGCEHSVPMTRMQVARARTMNAITRSASVATALLSPMKNQHEFDFGCYDDESEEDESDADAGAAPPSSSSAASTPTSILTPTSGAEAPAYMDSGPHAPSRSTRPKLSTRRFPTFTNMRILSRMQS